MNHFFTHFEKNLHLFLRFLYSNPLFVTACFCSDDELWCVDAILGGFLVSIFIDSWGRFSGVRWDGDGGGMSG